MKKLFIGIGRATFNIFRLFYFIGESVMFLTSITRYPTLR